MRFTLPFLLLATTGALAGRAQTPAPPAAPKTPKLTFLYSLNCTLGPSLDVGATPVGSRVVIPITGGTFSGPKLTGTSPTPLPTQPALTHMGKNRQSLQPRRRLGPDRRQGHLQRRYAVPPADGRRGAHFHPDERAGAGRRAAAPAAGV